MKPFEPQNAVHGVVQHGVDPSTLLSNRDQLEQSRLDLQWNLIRIGVTRQTMIQVNCQGVILQGNHGARAAAEAGMEIDLLIIDLPHPQYGPILSIPIVRR